MTGLDALAAGRPGDRRRILVATADVLTRKMAGPGIRAWQIASGLSIDHDVVLVTTSGRCEIEARDFGARAAETEELVDLETWCEVIVLQGFLLQHVPTLRSTQKIMIVDLYDPLHLEQLALFKHDDAGTRQATLANATAVLNEQLLRGDFFICASSKQRDFWLGQLAALGRVNPRTYDGDGMLRRLIEIVPFGLPDEPPAHTRKVLHGAVQGIDQGDEVILWGGGVYNWLDPLTLIEAIDRLRRRRPNVRLFFMGLRHPNPEVPEMRMAHSARALAGSLGLTGRHVFFNEDWVAYEDRQNYLLEASVGVSTHLLHLETAFSFRTRILDYIWAALPIVATQGDSFAELIEAEELGLTVPAGDIDGLEEALYRILADNDLADRCRRNLATVRARYGWNEVLRPLVDYCRSPRRAPDLVAS